jgi:hypothetical protein
MTQLGAEDSYDFDRHGELYVADPTDTAESLEAAIGIFLTTNPFDGLHFGHPDFAPSFEFLEEHATCFEIGFVLSDEGAVAIFVPKHSSIDPELIRFCDNYAVPAAVPSR